MFHLCKDEFRKEKGREGVGIVNSDFYAGGLLRLTLDQGIVL
jgi:hypothetical protein